MGSFSDYLEAKVLDHVFGATSYTPPATLYLAAFTANPSDSGGGTECTGGSYARKAVTNNTTNFPNASGTSPTSKSNGTVITFVQATAAWGTVSGVGVFDASSGGNLIAWSALASNKVIDTDDFLEIAAGALTFTLD